MNNLTEESPAIARLAPLKRGFPNFSHAPLTAPGAPGYLLTCARFIAESTPTGPRDVADLARHISTETGDHRTKHNLARHQSATDATLSKLPQGPLLRAPLLHITRALHEAQQRAPAEPAPLAFASALARALPRSPEALHRALRSHIGAPPLDNELLQAAHELRRHLEPDHARSTQQRRALIQLPGLIGTQLRATCLNARDPATARLSALSTPLQEAVAALAHEQPNPDAWQALQNAFAVPRAPDPAIVFAPISSYPFNLAEPAFSDDRHHYHSQPGSARFRRAANPATLEWLEANPAIIPVMCSREGAILDHTASARLFSEFIRRDPTATLAHTVCAAWNAQNGAAMVSTIDHPVDGWLENAAQHRPGDPIPDIRLPMPEPAERLLQDPESIALRARPGQPVFVIVAPCDLTPIHPHHSDTLYAKPARAGGNAPYGVHPHSLALSVASRLGGARDVSLLIREDTQGAMFTANERYHAAINLPLHHSAIGLLAQGANQSRILLHAGAPWTPHQPLTRFTPESAGRCRDITHNKTIRELHHARYGTAPDQSHDRPAHEQLFAWIHRLNERPDTQRWRHPGALPTDHFTHPSAASQPRNTQRIYGTNNARLVLRIALLINPERPEEARHCVRLLRHSAPALQFPDHDYLIPQPLWQSPDIAPTLRPAIADHYPYGLTDVGAHKTPPTSARIQVIGAADLTAEHCDLMLVGSLDPARPSHAPLLSVLARSAHEPFLRLAVAPSPLTDPATRALVWGSPTTRRERWSLRGARALEQILAHPDSARLIAGTARSQDHDTLIVHRPLTQLPPRARLPHGPPRYDAADPQIRAAYDTPSDKLATLYAEAPTLNNLERPPSRLDPELRQLQLDPHDLQRKPRATPAPQSANLAPLARAALTP